MPGKEDRTGRTARRRRRTGGDDAAQDEGEKEETGISQSTTKTGGDQPSGGEASASTAGLRPATRRRSRRRRGQGAASAAKAQTGRSPGAGSPRRRPPPPADFRPRAPERRARRLKPAQPAAKAFQSTRGDKAMTAQYRDVRERSCAVFAPRASASDTGRRVIERPVSTRGRLPAFAAFRARRGGLAAMGRGHSRDAMNTGRQGGVGWRSLRRSAVDDEGGPR
jgi:hypothetical protein